MINEMIRESAYPAMGYHVDVPRTGDRAQEHGAQIAPARISHNALTVPLHRSPISCSLYCPVCHM